MKNTDSTLSDSTLIEMFKAGDNEAFGKIAKRHSSAIDRHISKFFKDTTTIKDVRQDALIKAMTAISEGKYVEKNQCKTWLLRIAYNLAIDEIRNSKRRPSMLSYSPETDDFAENAYQADLSLDVYTKSPEDAIIEREARQYVQNLIIRLPVEQRKVILLRFYLDYSFKKIAEATNVSINTALGRMRYARLNLFEYIQDAKSSNVLT